MFQESHTARCLAQSDRSGGMIKEMSFAKAISKGERLK